MPCYLVFVEGLEENIIGKKVAGEGQSFEINIYGSKKLVPFLPWIK